jgi:DHA2 family multidrug resistance protein-like MFS transporter
MSSVADGLPLNKRLPAVIAISLGISMATLDTAIVNTALPTLAKDRYRFGFGDLGGQRLPTGNHRHGAAVCLLSDVLGHRRVCLGGLLLFILSSLFCGLAGSLLTLTVARVVQGLGRRRS